MGRLFWASEVFNCQAPDVPNMIALQNCATPEQKQRWLRPLLEAKTRSAFGMTEPDVASSDATNIATTIRPRWRRLHHQRPQMVHHRRRASALQFPDRDGRDRSRTPIAPAAIPASSCRWIRPASAWSARCAGWAARITRRPIGELTFDNVRIPRENLLGEEGEGFKVAQIRLGPARIHHCMRSIGLCELLIELMMVRAAERSAFGRTVIQYDTVQRWIAEARVELEQARLAGLSLRVAARPVRPSRRHWRDVSLIKVAVPAMLQRIADRAMQVFGAMGGSDDTPIHQALAWGRLLRIGDGPDEVHLRQIFRMEAMPSWSIADSPYLAAHPA